MINDFYTNFDDVQTDFYSIKEQSVDLGTPIEVMSIVKPIGLTSDGEWGGGGCEIKNEPLIYYGGEMFIDGKFKNIVADEEYDADKQIGKVYFKEPLLVYDHMFLDTPDLLEFPSSVRMIRSLCMLGYTDDGRTFTLPKNLSVIDIDPESDTWPIVPNTPLELPEGVVLVTERSFPNLSVNDNNVVMGGITSITVKGANPPSTIININIPKPDGVEEKDFFQTPVILTPEQYYNTKPNHKYDNIKLIPDNEIWYTRTTGTSFEITDYFKKDYRDYTKMTNFVYVHAGERKVIGEDESGRKIYKYMNEYNGKRFGRFKFVVPSVPGGGKATDFTPNNDWATEYPDIVTDKDKSGNMHSLWDAHDEHDVNIYGDFNTVGTGYNAGGTTITDKPFERVIDGGVFSGFGSLEEVWVPDCVQLLVGDVFANSKNLKVVRIGKKTKIGQGVFTNCTGLKYLILDGIDVSPNEESSEFYGEWGIEFFNKMNPDGEFTINPFDGCDDFKIIIPKGTWDTLKNKIVRNRQFNYQATRGKFKDVYDYLNGRIWEVEPYVNLFEHSNDLEGHDYLTKVQWD